MTNDEMCISRVSSFVIPPNALSRSNIACLCRSPASVEADDQVADEEGGFDQKQGDDGDFENVAFVPPTEIGDAVDGAFVEVFAGFESVAETGEAVGKIEGGKQ